LVITSIMLVISYTAIVLADSCYQYASYPLPENDVTGCDSSCHGQCSQAVYVPKIGECKDLGFQSLTTGCDQQTIHGRKKWKSGSCTAPFNCGCDASNGTIFSDQPTDYTTTTLTDCSG
jgi:hypothetical protein